MTNFIYFQGQVAEMVEWFKAFNKQDGSKRDYTKYFKPVLCYLEGTWTLDKELVEPFESDRHNLEAKSWLDLHEKVGNSRIGIPFRFQQEQSS